MNSRAAASCSASASGDTPVYTLGKKMARLARMRESIAAIRALTRGETVEYAEGVNVNMWCAREIPHIHLRRRPQDARHVR